MRSSLTRRGCVGLALGWLDAAPADRVKAGLTHRQGPGYPGLTLHGHPAEELGRAGVRASPRGPRRGFLQGAGHSKRQTRQLISTTQHSWGEGPRCGRLDTRASSALTGVGLRPCRSEFRPENEASRSVLCQDSRGEGELVAWLHGQGRVGQPRPVAPWPSPQVPYVPLFLKKERWELVSVSSSEKPQS